MFLLIEVVQSLAFGPVLGAASADEDQVEPVFGRLSENDCFRVAAPLALDSFSSFQRRVFNAFRVDLDVFRTHREVCPVHAVVQLIVLLRALVAVAKLALELEKIPPFFGLVLPSFEHVVTL